MFQAEVTAIREVTTTLQHNRSKTIGYIPQSYIKALMNQKVNLLDQIEWNRNGHCHTNTILGNKYKHTIKTLNEQVINNRIQYKTALQLIAGHIGLNKHLYTMSITNTTIVSFKSIGISSCGGIKQSWRNRVNCSHNCNVCCARGDGFKSRCYIYVYSYINFDKST